MLKNFFFKFVDLISNSSKFKLGFTICISHGSTKETEAGEREKEKERRERE